MSTVLLYVMTGALVLFSLVKDRTRTKEALKKGWKAFEHILPEFLSVILLIGLLLALIDPKVISTLIGSESGIIGLFLSLAVGSITLIPGFVAFPTAAMLLQGGAGYMQLGAFISSLMMVGVVTFPVERRFFGTKVTLLRNGAALVFSLVVALGIGMVMNR